MECVFKPGETYRTRDGREAFVGYERGGRLFGDIGDVACSWGCDGLLAEGYRPGRDLLPPAPPPIRETVYVNIYKDGEHPIWPTAAHAGTAATNSALRTAVPCMLIEIVDGEPTP